jgi:hypothetical protein
MRAPSVDEMGKNNPEIAQDVSQAMIVLVRK